MKKNILLFTCLFFLGASILTAQKKGGNHYEKVKTLKINFISSKLNLTPEVAEKFWPIYNEYEEVNRRLRSSNIRKLKNEINSKGSIETLSDQQALEYSNKFINLSERYASNKRNCFQKLELVLTPQQLLQLHFAEMEFNFKVLRKLHKEKMKKH